MLGCFHTIALTSHHATFHWHLCPSREPTLPYWAHQFGAIDVAEAVAEVLVLRVEQVVVHRPQERPGSQALEHERGELIRALPQRNGPTDAG
jgi:hypothetical protein